MERSQKKIKVTEDEIKVLEHEIVILPIKKQKLRIDQYTKEEEILKLYIVKFLKKCDLCTMCAVMEASLPLRNFMEKNEMWQSFARPTIQRFDKCCPSWEIAFENYFQTKKLNYFWLMLCMLHNYKDTVTFSFENKDFCKIDFETEKYKIWKNRANDDLFLYYAFVVKPLFTDETVVTEENMYTYDRFDYLKQNNRFKQLLQNIKAMTKQEYYFDGKDIEFAGFKHYDVYPMHILYAALCVKGVKMVVKQKYKINRNQNIINKVDIKNQFYI